MNNERHTSTKRLIAFPVFLASMALLLCACSPQSRMLADRRGEVGRERAPLAERFTVRAEDPTLPIGFSAAAALKSGEALLRVSTPDGKEVFSTTLNEEKASVAKILDGPPPKELRLELKPEDASGKWHLTVVQVSCDEVLTVAFLSGVIVLLLVAAVVVITRRRFDERFRWFWIGAALWAAAVALKVVSSVFTMELVLEALEGALPHGVYVALGSFYVGLHSALFEIGLTILAAYLWKSFSASRDRAVTIGVGAGAFEAALIGLSAIGGGVAAAVGVDEVSVAMSSQCATTPLPWLVAAVERALTIPVHVAARVLVLYGVARGQRMQILWGFVLFTLIDTVGGGAHVAQLVGRLSTWWIEAALLPFAAVSIWTTRRVIKAWSGSESR